MAQSFCGLLALGALLLALAGCGNPAPSTPIAPDMPQAQGANAGSPDLSKIKANEHTNGTERK